MRITSVHERRLDTPPQVAGALLADLGAIWPDDRWPTAPLAFDRPLGVGADGGHGVIRYRVSAYEPGRRLEFTFSPGLGLTGTHELRVEPAGPGRATLRHELDVRVAPWLLPAVPVLRAQHDALVEDLLDGAQRATGEPPARPARHSRLVAVTNGAEIRLTRLLGRRGPRDLPARVAGVAVPTVLAALAGLHAVWATGSTWPAGSLAELSDAVFSQGESMPPAWATWSVAGLLLAGAAIVRRAARPAPSARMRALTLALAGVFGLRAVAYLPSDLAGGLATTYQRMDLALYAPLCLAIAVGAAAVARRHGPAPAAPTRARAASAP